MDSPFDVLVTLLKSQQAKDAGISNVLVADDEEFIEFDHADTTYEIELNAVT